MQPKKEIYTPEQLLAMQAEQGLGQNVPQPQTRHDLLPNPLFLLIACEGGFETLKYFVEDDEYLQFINSIKNDDESLTEILTEDEKYQNPEPTFASLLASLEEIKNQERLSHRPVEVPDSLDSTSTDQETQSSEEEITNSQRKEPSYSYRGRFLAPPKFSSNDSSSLECSSDREDEQTSPRC